MNPKFRRIAVFTGAVALAGGAGIAAASYDGSDAAGSGPALTRPAQGGGRGGPDLSALAGELGVSESRLRAALEAARPRTGGPGSGSGSGSGGSGPPDGTDMAEALASELGLSVDKVQAALEAAMPFGDGGPQGGAAPPAGGAPPGDGSSGGPGPGGDGSSGGAAPGDGSSGDGSSGSSGAGSLS